MLPPPTLENACHAFKWPSEIDPLTVGVDAVFNLHEDTVTSLTRANSLLDLPSENG